MTTGGGRGNPLPPFHFTGTIAPTSEKYNRLYNPIYNLRAMPLRWKSIKWWSRGNMNMEDENKCKNENEPDAGSESLDVEQLLGRCYEICIGGKLDSSWSDWFEGFEMSSCGKDWTTLCGFVADQAALIGILNKLCRLNLPLVSVNEVAGSERSACSGEEGGE